MRNIEKKFLTLKNFLIVLVVLFTINCGISNSKATKENYEKIYNGMTSLQVKEILGEPDSSSESELPEMNGRTSKLELWHYQLGMQAIDITLQNKKVISKNWTKL